MEANVDNIERADRMPPHSVEAEREVLGSMLAAGHCVAEVAEVVRPAHFFLAEHQIIADAIFALWAENRPVDALTVREALIARGLLEDAGGVQYLGRLLTAFPTAANAAEYAAAVRRHAVLRTILAGAERLAAKASAGSVEDPAALAEAAAGQFLDAAAVLEDVPRVANSAHLIAIHPTMKPVIIEGMLRRGEVMNVVASPKVGKTWFIHGLAMRVVTGSEWLGRFAITPGRVLLIDNELHPETLAHRLRSVAEANEVPIDYLRQRLDVLCLRGALCSIDGLPSRLRGIHPGQYALIVLDALYKFYPERFDENSNSDMTRLYQRLDALAKAKDCAIAVVHHSTKGGQADKEVVDVGAGASAQARAADAHTIIREHELEDHFVFDAGVRSFGKLQPVVIRRAFPTWQVVEDADPNALKRANGKGAAKTKSTDWTPDRVAVEIATAEPASKQVLTRRLRDQGISWRDAEALIQEAIETQKIHPHKGVNQRPNYANIEATNGQYHSK
jgi:hypothetical protein